MAGPRQPIDLILYKGNKHLTKKEIEERKEGEIRAPNDKVKAPSYLPSKLKKEFNKIAKDLLAIKIMTNLDVDALARFIYAREMYVKITDKLLETELTKVTMKKEKGPEGEVIDEIPVVATNEIYTELLLNQDKLFKQCRQAAADLGLTISSRCRLVMPKTEEEKPKTAAEKRFGDRL